MARRPCLHDLFVRRRFSTDKHARAKQTAARALSAATAVKQHTLRSFSHVTNDADSNDNITADDRGEMDAIFHVGRGDTSYTTRVRSRFTRVSVSIYNNREARQKKKNKPGRQTQIGGI